MRKQLSYKGNYATCDFSTVSVITDRVGIAGFVPHISRGMLIFYVNNNGHAELKQNRILYSTDLCNDLHMK